jgi:hypothetical protein
MATRKRIGVAAPSKWIALRPNAAGEDADADHTRLAVRGHWRLLPLSHCSEHIAHCSRASSCPYGSLSLNFRHMAHMVRGRQPWRASVRLIAGPRAAPDIAAALFRASG